MTAVLGGFIFAAVVYGVWHLTWVAVAIVAACSVGRWAAMLIADAYPHAPRRRR